jgi:CheY-like chemotaxis protein
MIDKRVRLLVTTIVRTVVEGAPLSYLVQSRSPDQLKESPFAERARTHADVSGHPRVLVVDDETLIADSVAEILNRNGYAATATYSGDTAIQFIQERCPDIIVSDVVMPDINGIQLAKLVRVHCPNSRIVLFSGNVDTSSLLDDASIDGYFFEVLSKPVHPVQLLKALKS